MRRDELISIDRIHNEYAVSIWDNCSLQSHLNGKGEIHGSGEFAEFFINKIPKYKCYIPKSVEGEYLKGRNGDGRLDIKEDELISKFENERKILCVEGHDFGECVKKADGFFKKIREEYGIDLQETDFRVFSWALAFSQKYGSAAIISNDIKGIGKLWGYVISKTKLNCDQLGFFPRVDLDRYRRFVA